MRSLPNAACLWLISGISSLVQGQSVNVTAVDNAYVQPQQADSYYGQEADHYILPEELDQMLAPIALYPDSLLSQTLMAATYPLEVVQADRWVRANAHLNADEAARALEGEQWDPSVKSLVNFPDVLAMLSDRLDWTQQLGDAFLAQPQDVADSIQRLRASAWNSGNLVTTEQQVVYVQQQASSPIIVIEPAVPDIIYVPAYDPVVVYGYWPYPAYPPYRHCPRGYVVTNVISFGFGRHCGFAWGYAWGRWDWGHRDIRINIDINIGRNSYINPTRYAGYPYPDTTWRHDPLHRHSVPYRSESLARLYDGSSVAQTVHSRESYRGRSSSIVLERLGSPELASLDERNRDSSNRVTREQIDRSRVPEASRDSQRDTMSRMPRSTDTNRDRSPTIDRDRTPVRDDDRVAYVPAQPVNRSESRSSGAPIPPPVTREPRTTQPVTREPGRVEPSTRDLDRRESRDREVRFEGSRDAGRSDPMTRQPSRPDFTTRDPVRVEPVGREPSRTEPLHIDSVRRDPIRTEPQTRGPLRIDPVRRDPIRIESQTREHPRIDPVRRDPIRIEPQPREPLRIDPIRREPSRPEPKTTTIQRLPSSVGGHRSPGSIFDGVTRSGREASSHNDHGKSSRSTKVGSGSTRKQPQTTRR